MIHIYPRIAKYSLVIIIATSIVSFLIIAPSGAIFSINQKFRDIAAIALAFLAIPSFAAWSFLINTVNKEAEQVGFKDDAALATAIQPLLEGIPGTVRVGQFPSNVINAFCITPIFSSESIIAFSTGLLAVATPAQFMAVAAHEVAHLKNEDGRNKVWILAFHRVLNVYPYIVSEVGKVFIKATGLLVLLIIGIVFFIAYIGGNFQWSNLSNMLLSMSEMLKPYLVLIVFIVGYPRLERALCRLSFYYSRQREFVADRDGAKMTSPQDLKSILALLSDPGEVVGVFDAHPPVNERISRLG